MRSQMFALIIGIDNYKSGSIWNLDSCVSDARRMSRWLTSDLGIPKSHIRLLLDEEATLQNIEASFLEHLVNNKSVHKGDAVLLYFAGHGSLVKAPGDWYDTKMPGREIQVLCPFDHDTKAPSGRIAGLSEPSLTALLNELSLVKGDNITLIIDSCFSPPSNKRDRRHIRWTPTQKATAEDLRSCMWKGAGTPTAPEPLGFYNTRITSHILLAACGANETAAEGKDGGKFTSALLDAVRTVPLRRSSYNRLVENVVEQTGDDQRPICLGATSRLVFGSTPFVPNAAFRSVSIHDEKLFRVEAGSIHGIVKGHELSIHSHNYSGQKNPPIASVVVREIHPTYCLVHRKSFSVTQPDPLPPDCWALAKPPSTRSIHAMTWFQKLCAALRPIRAALRVPGQPVVGPTIFTEKGLSAEPAPMNALDEQRPIPV